MLFRDLQTSRMILKVIGDEDAEFLYKQFSNKQVNLYLYDAEPFTSTEDAMELIKFYKEPEPRNQNRWILINKDTSEKMGTCGFHCWDRTTGRCELGYDLYPDYRKYGYMQEALIEILSFAKTDMQIKFVETHIYVDNIDSIKTSERQGFVNTKKTYNEVFRGVLYPHYIFEKEF